MNSMTGYGHALAAMGAHTLNVQISSVNRRGLDLSLSLPDEWQRLETPIAEAIRKVVLRGKVHVAVDINGSTESGGAWDEAAVGRTLDQLATLARARQMKFEPTVELLWQVANAQRPGSQLPPAEAAAGPLLAAVHAALHALAAMRAKEGAALLADLVARLANLDQLLGKIAGRAPLVTAGYREQLLQRLRQAGLPLDVGDERVLKEVALFADRCDVSEELTRLRHHLAQLNEVLRSAGETGRKSDFILQEIGREIHTVGSKANDLTIAQLVIEFKNELERVREQTANVE